MPHLPGPAMRLASPVLPTTSLRGNGRTKPAVFFGHGMDTLCLILDALLEESFPISPHRCW